MEILRGVNMVEIEKVHCEVCKKDIPTSVVITAEGAEYVHHFCSVECQEH